MTPPNIILEVVFYQSQTGSEPVRDWLKSFNTADKKLIGEDVKTVQYGWPLGMPLVKKLDTGLWEVRINISQGIVRLIFTVVACKMVLLHGFIKKTQKTPIKELAIAKDRLKSLNME